MSKVAQIGQVRLIEVSPDPEKANCELCGKFAELRPYGENGEKICSDCGKKNSLITRKQIYMTLLGFSEKKALEMAKKAEEENGPLGG